MDFIEITGAKSHNLKNISLKIPRDRLVVVTGLSGSGKSSLAFDTIYAEGQRRYMDTLSPYARQFMGMMERPDVDDVRGLSPIIAIEQKTTGRNPRSTVGTMTEIYDFFRLLYARASTAYSPATGKEMVKYTDDMIVDLIISDYEGEKLLLLAPIVRGRKGHYKELFEQLVKRGYSQVRIDGEIHYLRDVEPLDRYKNHFIELVVDKLVPCAEDRKRIRSSVVTALSQGKGSIALLKADGQGGLRYLSKNLICADTGISFSLPAPYTFSFNSPQGACPHCNGLGVVAELDMSKVIPNDKLSIAEGGIVSLGSMRNPLHNGIDGHNILPGLHHKLHAYGYKLLYKRHFNISKRSWFIKAGAFSSKHSVNEGKAYVGLQLKNDVALKWQEAYDSQDYRVR